MNLTTVINYCSIDSRFIKRNVEECSIFSDKIIISCFPVFLAEGEPDLDLETSLQDVKTNKKVSIEMNQWTADFYPAYWINQARVTGWKKAKNQSDHILFLDADEIPEGLLVKLFLNDYYPNLNYDVMQFACYNYFREPIYRSLEIMGCGALWKTNSIQEEFLTTKFDRWGYRFWKKYKLPRLRYRDEILLKGQALFHHYSWVRSKEQMLNKVKNWGHYKDKDWKVLVEKEFSRPFNGRDFYGNKYEVVDNHLGI